MLDQLEIFYRPRRRKLVLTQQVEPENIIGRLDAAAIPPAETSSVIGATPVSGKGSVVLM